jgi:hypothetical protein
MEAVVLTIYAPVKVSNVFVLKISVENIAKK